MIKKINLLHYKVFKNLSANACTQINIHNVPVELETNIPFISFYCYGIFINKLIFLLFQ